MPKIKIYQREYELPEFYGEEIRHLEAGIRRSQGLIRGRSRMADC